MSNILNLKKNPSELLKQLREAAEKQTKKGGHTDERFWKPTFDKEKGIGSAIVRFLPSVDDDTLPWTQIYFRQFQGENGKWYIENDLSTIGRKDDPVGNLAWRCYNSGIESDKKNSSFLKRKVKFIMNVYVIKDSMNPESDGKVFLYECGKQIFDLINAARVPKFEDQIPIEPFNPWTGANFNFRIVGKEITDARGKKATVPNYEQSNFSNISPMFSDDEIIVKVCEKAKSLKEFTTPDKFLEVEELRRKLFDVLGPTILSGIETIPGFSGTVVDNRAPSVNIDERSNPRVRESGRPETLTQSPPETTEEDDMAFMESLLVN